MNAKTHILALTMALLVAAPVIMLIRHINKDDEVAVSKPAANAGYSINISSATWGYNCHGNIYYDDSARRTYTIARDNVIEKVRELCNGKQACELTAASDFFDLDPAPQCSKQLDISYRCFDYDRRRDVRAYSLETAQLACEPSPAH